MKLFKKLNLHRLFCTNFSLNQAILKKHLAEEYGAYLKLKEWFNGRQISKKKVTFYYPGSGSDILSALAICDAVISPLCKEIELVFQDTRDMFDGTVYQISKYTTKPVVVVHDTKDICSASFYFKDKTIKLLYHVSDFNYNFPSELKSGIDIYYERAFEMFRSYEQITMYKIYSKIKPLGLLMTDHSFRLGKDSKNFKKLKGIPSYFGLYKKFQIWQKVKSP
jgi:hypothetical protein